MDIRTFLDCICLLVVMFVVGYNGTVEPRPVLSFQVLYRSLSFAANLSWTRFGGSRFLSAPVCVYFYFWRRRPEKA